jgi:hypothetical protein
VQLKPVAKLTGDGASNRRQIQMDSIMTMGWGSPIGLGILLAGLGVFFWGLGKTGWIREK